MEKILKKLREIKCLLKLQKKVLNLEEFCDYTGISKAYAYHLTSNGKIKCYRPFGKMIYFDIDEVIEFLKQNHTDGERETKLKLEKHILNNI